MAIGSITVRRMSGFVASPSYQVTLRSDGSALWHGDMLVDRIGDWIGKFDPATFTVLASFVDSVGFFSWLDEYTTLITCQPADVMVVRRDGKEKSVSQYGYTAPGGFLQLIGMVELIATQATWDPVKTRKRRNLSVAKT